MDNNETTKGIEIVNEAMCESAFDTQDLLKCLDHSDCMVEAARVCIDVQKKRIEKLEKALTDIADQVRWGIQYRYIARDTLEGDPSIDLEFPPGMAFDCKGDTVTDYGPEHDTELARRLKEDK